MKKKRSHPFNGFGNFSIKFLLLYFRSAAPFWISVCICILCVCRMRMYRIRLAELVLTFVFTEHFFLCVFFYFYFVTIVAVIVHCCNCSRILIDCHFIRLANFLFSFNLPHQYHPSYYSSFHYSKGAEICRQLQMRLVYTYVLVMIWFSFLGFFNPFYNEMCNLKTKTIGVFLEHEMIFSTVTT